MQSSFVAAAIAAFESWRKIAWRDRRSALATVLLCACAAGCAALEREFESTREREEEAEREQARTPLSPDAPIAVGIVIADGVRDTELMAPCGVFQHTTRHARPGMTVFTVASSTSPLRTCSGLRLLADHEFDDAPRIDILVVPGIDDGQQHANQDPELLEFVRERAERARYVVSLRDGALVLARAGVLRDQACTTSPDEMDALKQGFPALDVQSEVSFVQSGRVLTSQGGVHSYEVALYLAELIYGMDVAQAIGRGFCIDWNLGRVAYIGTLDEPAVHDEDEDAEREREREREPRD